MRLLRTLLACCLLYGLLTEAALHTSASGDSPQASSEGISVKSTASTFLTSVFGEKGIDLDPRTWVVDDTDEVPKTWKISSMPQYLLAREWWEGAGWVVTLYHEETPHLKPIVRVMVKVIIGPNPGDHALLLPILIPNYFYPNKQLKLIAMANVIHPGITGPELREALCESLNNTLPVHFHDQIPNSDATVPEVIQWLKLWFVEDRKSSTAIMNTIKRLRWDGNYLWSAGKRRIQKDFRAVGFSEAYSDALTRDIVAARARFDSQRWITTKVNTKGTTIAGRFLLAAVLLPLLYFIYHRFLNQWE